MDDVAARIDAAGPVLAAGAGRRFGKPKAAVLFEGERLVDRAVRLLRDGVAPGWSWYPARWSCGCAGPRWCTIRGGRPGWVPR
ncbi:NTP transferase domain-containing protein [Nocardia sp. NPDC002869]|uniref:NTP transferase domain-containing protein n=1 Tax=Nocardia sp. NPDC002869 TaxID=3161032 RepID=UPI00398C9ECB